MTDRKPAAAACLTCFLLALLLGAYVIGFPLGVWMAWRWPVTKPTVERIYSPVLRACLSIPESGELAILSWGSLLLRTERQAAVGLRIEDDPGFIIFNFPVLD